MPADPRPRKRVKNPELLAEMAQRPCQITRQWDTGRSVNEMIDTHHLVKQPRHDEPGNLFRILHSLHMEFEQGKRRRAVGALIRAFMTPEQEAYVVRERGEAWLDATYPEV